jgi:L-2,4-diaminobutyrate decarboxylase
MPYVEGYGTWPFGEEWLWEAMATSYLPLLDVLEAAPELTLSLTPVLCDQLAAPGVGERFAAFLRDVRPETHRRDIADAGDPAVAAELERSAALYAHAGERFGALGGDLLAALAPHAAWTSSATHAVLPLLATDAGVRLQVRTGVESHRARFAAARPWRGGFWSPECAHGAWLDPLLEEEGVHATCVDLTDVLGRGSEAQLRPLRSADGPLLVPIDREVIELVWHRDGYPAGAAYRDSHNKTTYEHRPWRNDGAVYDPVAAREQARADAADFVDRVERRIAGGGLCVFAIDTELLGHWWHEGIDWLRFVVERCRERGVPVAHLDDALAEVTPEPAPAVLPVTSWGRGATCRPGRRRRSRGWRLRRAQPSCARSPARATCAPRRSASCWRCSPATGRSWSARTRRRRTASSARPRTRRRSRPAGATVRAGSLPRRAPRRCWPPEPAPRRAGAMMQRVNPSELRAAADVALDELEAYVDRSVAGDEPPTSSSSPADVAARLDLPRLLRDGGLAGERLGPWLAAYLRDSVRLHSPRQLAHQVGVPDVGAALADLVHGVANQPMSIYEMGAGAASVERAVVDWMVERVGWSPADAGGVLTHGGSLANLTALLAARARIAPDAWRDGAPADLALLAPASAHYSVKRAAGILGLGGAAVVPIEVDELERVRVDRLGNALERARAAGRRPMALVAAACATSTGLYDDLRAIGTFCREHDLWFHVDGAHGASALLSERHRSRLDGIDLADSVIWDAHKMLRTTALCAAVLVRRRADLPGAFQQDAAYLDFDDPRGMDVLDRQVECTKAELGLKVFLSLAWQGEAAVGRYVDEQVAKAQRLAELVDERPGFSALCRPEANILCFRHDASDPGAVRAALLEQGAFHLSTTEVAGVPWLRVAIMAPATDEATLVALIDAVEDAA